ncbi:phosphoglycerate kinase [Candidatus Gribaldobacteria bacterium]|nr:phosphoglycerate kinase [Candidatus Gribaldobacteria bacterium]
MIKNGFNIKTIDDSEIIGKKVILRVDYNISLGKNRTLADDARIRQTLPTINYLLKNHNKIIIITYLDRPKTRDSRYSLKPVAKHLQSLLPNNKIILANDFLTKIGKQVISSQEDNEIIMLENIRFYKQEKKNDPNFAKKIAELANIYINDAFGQCHRAETTIVGVPEYLPSYAGLLLKKEVETISQAIKKPKKPFVVILGGAKISTKILLIDRLMAVADYLLIGGGLANTFLAAEDYEIGRSFCEYEEIQKARRLLFMAAKKHTAIILPSDVVIGNPKNITDGGIVKKINEVLTNAQILDIGPETQAKFGSIITKAKTIIWNGPVGYFENPEYRRGTDFIYYAIAQNQQATSIVGGGDTLAAISKKEYLDKITHISTGGGAMLEFIEKGTLPGIEALKR